MANMAELDPKYADVILRRFEEFTGQKPELIEDPTQKQNKTA